MDSTRGLIATLMITSGAIAVGSTAGAVEFPPGTEVSAVLSVIGTPPVPFFSLDVQVMFDEMALDPVEAPVEGLSVESLLPSSALVAANETGMGVAVVGIAVVAGVNQAGDVWRLDFTALEALNLPMALAFDVTSVTDQFGTEITPPSNKPMLQLVVPEPNPVLMALAAIATLSAIRRVRRDR